MKKKEIVELLFTDFTNNEGIRIVLNLEGPILWYRNAGHGFRSVSEALARINEIFKNAKFIGVRVTTTEEILLKNS